MIDLSPAIELLSSEHTIKNVSITTTNFVQSIVVTSRSQECLVQSAEKDKLNPDTIDYSNDYLMVHSLENLNNGEYILYKSKDFKFIGKGDYNDFGYCEQLAEETKRPLLVST
jgi:hypothetical protein